MLLLAALTGCASYAPLPLPGEAGLAPSVRELAGAPAHDRLTVADITVLALENNPDLRATRAQHGVAQAQLLQAGLLPNPNITGAILPLAAGPGSTFAWNAGLSTDVTALITLSARRRSAAASAQQVDAQIVWQEWQTVGQARLLAVDIIEGGQILALLQRQVDLLSSRVDRSRQAVAAGNATLTTLAPDVAAQQIRASYSFRIRRGWCCPSGISSRRCLAWRPMRRCRSPSAMDLPPLDLVEARRALPTLADRRPDLVALRLGYAAAGREGARRDPGAVPEADVRRDRRQRQQQRPQRRPADHARAADLRSQPGQHRHRARDAAAAARRICRPARGRGRAGPGVR